MEIVFGFFTFFKQNKRAIAFFSFLLFCANVSNAQINKGSEASHTVDSLKLVLQNAKHDTTRIDALIKWASNLVFDQPEEAITILNKAQILAEKNSAVDPVKIGDGTNILLNESQKTDKKDTPKGLKYIYLKKLADIYYKTGIANYTLGDTEKALKYYYRSLNTYNLIIDEKGIAACFIKLGVVNYELGKAAQAQNYFESSLKIYEDIKDNNGRSNALNSLAIVYTSKGQIKEALDYYQQSLKIKESIGDKSGIALTLNNIANMYSEQGQFNEAMDYYNKSLKFYEEINDKQGMADANNNIGIVYNDRGQLNEALEYYKRGLKLSEEVNDKIGTAMYLCNIGAIYTNQGKLIEALECTERSLKLNEEVKYQEGIAKAFINLSDIYFLQNKLSEALTFGVKGLQMSKELAYPDLIKYASLNLKVIYQKQNNPKKALEMYALYITMRDSVHNEDNRKASYKSKLQYEYSKKALTDSIRSVDEKKISSAQLAESQAKLKQEKTQKFALYIIAVILLLLAGTLSYNYRQKNRSNQQLSLQKDQIELKNGQLEEQKKDITNQNLMLEAKNILITDSIEYAKKIQDSMLPDAGNLIKHFSDAFIYYQPKDIVSGDFYWINETTSGIVLAVGDCTGHGVPGALMSVLGHNCLDAAYGQISDLSPVKVIQYADTYMKQKTRNQNSNSGNVDGMALSLIHYNKETKMMSYSSANQYIYIVREKELIEIKGNGFSVGSLQSQIIIGGEMQLVKDDMVYMFSDGYADQKGGPQKRKFMYPKLKNLFIEIAALNAEQQHKAIKKEIQDWKGDLSQIDDILVVGIRA